MHKAIEIEHYLYSQCNGDFYRVSRDFIASTIAVLQKYKQYSIIINIGLGKDKAEWRREHDQADVIINSMLEIDSMRERMMIDSR